MKKIIQITSGRGPKECNLVVTNVFKRFSEACRKSEIKFEVIERDVDKDFNQLSSIVIALEGSDLTNFLKGGLVQFCGEVRVRTGNFTLERTGLLVASN
ncbi:hypothetical protein [Empedobacter brevis]|uniref:hypothetical protein n=1 Tax=Empedobacter brevis TaxID=247 RepID=UPI002FE3B686